MTSIELVRVANWDLDYRWTSPYGVPTMCRYTCAAESRRPQLSVWSGSTKIIGMTKPDNPNAGTYDSGDDDTSSAKNDGKSGSDCPATESREQRLKRIQADVAAGKYDSDEMLDRALEIMLEKLSDSRE